MERIGTITYFYGDITSNNGGVQEFDIENLSSRSTWNEIKSRKCGDDSFFEYEDEDGDNVKGNTEEEWKAVLSTASKTKDFGVNVFSGSTSCHEKLSKQFECCTTSTRDCQKGLSGCCHPPPDTYVWDGTPPIKRENPNLSSYKYTDEALVAVTLPLGPLGGGSISIAGDGGLRQWQISNKVNHVGHVPNSFFGLRINNSSYVLQSSSNYEPPPHFLPAPIVTDNFVPPASIALLHKVTGVKTVEVTAKYPVVEVDYKDPSFEDFSVHMEAWSPKIPLNADTCALPVIYFDFTVTNASQGSAEVSVLGSLQNLVGWDGHTVIQEENKFVDYGGNTNEVYAKSSVYGIKMINESKRSTDTFNGAVSIFALPTSDMKKSTLLQYDKVDMLWDVFSKSSTLSGQGIKGDSPVGTTFNGAMNLTTTVPAGSSQLFRYAMAWHFPNKYKDWTVTCPVPNTDMFVGNHYAKLWKSIDDVMDTAGLNYDANKKWTYQFRDDMFDSTLPWQLVDSVAGRISVLNSPSCMWHADGYFYAFEGCSTTSGCCPLNCTHVLNYEMSLSYLFPQLERTMREIDLLFQINPYGVIPSRTNCPLELRRIWNPWPDYSTNPASCYICIDGEIGTVLKAYREVKNGAGLKWLTSLWKPIKKVMQRWLCDLDTNKNGMIYGPQPNTYDVSTYGYSIFIGLLYLCALRAAAEMSLLFGDTEKEFHDQCMSRFVLGSTLLDKTCYNGQWYIHVPDPKHMTNLMTDGTFVGVMYGQWWANILDLGYLLPKEHIHSHLLSVYTRNFVEKFDKSTQKPRAFADELDSGWVTGKWDKGKEPKNGLLYSKEMAWSGVIYPFASLLLQEGHIEEGLNVLDVTRKFYDGTRRSPWNEIECGDHYTRAMSSFALNLTASGQKWTADEEGKMSVRFNPILNKENYVGFMVLPSSCWGTYSQIFNGAGGQAKLKISYGTVTLTSFGVGINASNELIKSVTVGEINVPFKTVKDDTYMIAKLTYPLSLKSGDVLMITYTKQ